MYRNIKLLEPEDLSLSSSEINIKLICMVQRNFIARASIDANTLSHL